MIERRQFSEGLKGKNLRYLNDNASATPQVVRCGFLLLEHFSLPAFTQVLDTLVTANLLRPGVFTTRTFGLSGLSGLRSGGGGIGAAVAERSHAGTSATTLMASMMFE